MTDLRKEGGECGRDGVKEIQSLLKSIEDYNPDFDRELVVRAFEFAREAHQGQNRLSGEPFIVHPLAVAQIAADLRMDDATIVASLLHDVLEDTEAEEEKVRELFGEEILKLVQGVTKLELDFSYSNEEEAQVENYRRLFVAIAEDIRVIIIKLADRLHNMRTLKFQYRGKKESIARETLEVFAPIASRLGMGMIQAELENLSLFFLDPEAYCSLQRRVERVIRTREKQMEEAVKVLKGRLEKAGIEAEIQNRVKHLYSIYQKLNRSKISLEDLHDLIALRVITRTVEDCYAVLGIVHSLWRPVEGRFKDYVAVPKSNMYQSLHTTVIGPQGEPMEIQIRTWEMHQMAEYGIAAHWRYKEGKISSREDAFEERMSWLRQILEWQQDLRSTREFMESLKISLFDDEVYVFTPKGDLKKLPKGSTPIDFAYLIHTEVGNSCIGAKVNKQIVSLGYQLQSGDVVEIITSRSSSGPSADWLRIARTPGARNRIRAFLRKQNREVNRERGREILERELAKYTMTPEEEAEVSQELKTFMEQNGIKTMEDLYIAIGEGRYRGRRIVNQIVPDAIRRRSLKKKKSSSTSAHQPQEDILIQGTPGLAIKLARCCTPIPGDRIVAFVTQGRGMKVHRVDCPNLARLSQNGSRVLEAEWGREEGQIYDTGIVVEALDRPKLLADVSGAVSNCDMEIKAVRARSTVSGEARIQLMVGVRNKKELEFLFKELRKVANVRKIWRGGGFNL